MIDTTTCYRALRARDRRFDGRFFTGVRTTGVYCRPVCPAPPPRRDHVEFFACAAAAEAAGYRPCKRCRPETAPGTPAWAGSSAVVARALRLVQQGALDEGGVDALAARLGVGGRQLRRLFEQHLGTSPSAIARAQRAHGARRLIDETALPMTTIAFAAGYRSVRQYNHAMRAAFGASPQVLRRQARGRTVASDGIALRLPYRPPLDWHALLAVFTPRATPGVEVVSGDTYARTVRVGNARGWIEVAPIPDAPALQLRAHLSDAGAVTTVVERARRLFDLDADPLTIAAQLRTDRWLAPLVDRRPGLRVAGAWDPFELAVRAILGQQITVRGATTLAGRLVAALGEPLECDGRLTHLFPDAPTLADADVAAIGVPRSRAGAIRALARAVADATLVLDAARGLDDAVARLTALPGIGEWTAQYIAMRAFGEPDAFPHGDLSLRIAYGHNTAPVPAAKLAQAAEAWRPWRAYAAVQLWNHRADGEDK